MPTTRRSESALPHRRSLAALAALAMLPAASAAAVRLEPCRLEGLAEEVLCASHEVYENREAGAGRRIRLRLAVLPALSSRSAPDPLFLLAGGPGQAATDYGPLAVSAFRKVRAKRDIVLVDRRGTGESNPLDCQFDTDLLAGLAGDSLSELDAAACLADLDADVRYYTTDLAMDDLDEVRELLGYDLINLWGGSYGTRAAMVYLERHGAHVRSVILDGVAPHAIKLPLYYARDGQRALDLLLADCARDPGCDTAFPRLEEQLEHLLSELAAEPRTAALAHPRTGEPIEVTVTAAGFAGNLRNFLYVPRHSSLVPWIVHRAAGGDFAPLVAASHQAMSWSLDTMSLGLTLSVMCSEELPRISAAETAQAGRDSFLGSLALDVWTGMCDGWPRGRLSAERTASSEVPALLLSGALDPVTPPSWGELALESFANGRHFVVPGAAHNTGGSRCVQELMARFIEAGSAAGLDGSCVQNIERPKFVVGLAGTAP